MLRLHKHRSRAGRAGQALPTPYDSFDIHNVGFRMAGTSMIAGKPGACKSIFALNLLVRWAETGKTAYYFAADGDEMTLTERAAAIVTGDNDIEVVRPALATGQTQRYDERLEVLQDVCFSYHSDLSLSDIEKRLVAFEAVYGEYPDLVFIDNLINFAESPQDWNGMGAFLVAADTIAKKIKSHICILHHASESREYGNANDPVPLSAVQGKLSQIPALILTVAKNGMMLAVVAAKNRHGPADPAAQFPMYFDLHPSLQVTDNYRREI